jgi:hypothetical protein
MIRHGPTCLAGPVTKERPWWSAPAPEGRAADGTPAGEGLRPDLVRRVRAEIAAGTYDTPEKLEIALDRLLDRLSQA